MMILLLSCRGAPISWKKTCIGDSLVWCGWRFNFANETIELCAAKREKLCLQMQGLLSYGRQKGFGSLHRPAHVGNKHQPSTATSYCPSEQATQQPTRSQEPISRLRLEDVARSHLDPHFGPILPEYQDDQRSPTQLALACRALQPFQPRLSHCFLSCQASPEQTLWQKGSG